MLAACSDDADTIRAKLRDPKIDELTEALESRCQDVIDNGEIRIEGGITAFTEHQECFCNPMWCCHTETEVYLDDGKNTICVRGGQSPGGGLWTERPNDFKLDVVANTAEPSCEAQVFGSSGALQTESRGVGLMCKDFGRRMQGVFDRLQGSFHTR